MVAEGDVLLPLLEPPSLELDAEEEEEVADVAAALSVEDVVESVDALSVGDDDIESVEVGCKVLSLDLKNPLVDIRTLVEIGVESVVEDAESVLLADESIALDVAEALEESVGLLETALVESVVSVAVDVAGAAGVVEAAGGAEA